MVEKIVQIVGRGKIRHISWPENYLNVETGDYVADISKINEMISWSPEVSLEEGILKTVNYYLKYREFYTDTQTSKEKLFFKEFAQ